MSFVPRAFLALMSCATLWIPSRAALAETPITLAMPSFNSEASEAFQINGDAIVSGSDLRLTKDAPFLWGAALNKNFTTLGADASFSAYFTFSMATASQASGADGLAFLMQTNLTSKPGEGRTIGYAGAGPSVAIEFDTFLNGDSADPSDNHIGINLNSSTKSVAAVPAPVALNNGSVYHVWVDYNGAEKNLEVRISDSENRPPEATLQHTVDLSEIFPGAVFLGFSAATGAGHEEHNIKSLYFHREFVEGGLIPSQNEYVTDPAS